jgi:polyisoprenoid-binding protein YceI
MKTRILIALAFAAIATSCIQAPDGEKVKGNEAITIKMPLNAKQTDVDLDKSTIEWLGSKPGGTHFGTLSIQSGTLYFDGNKLLAGEFTMNMNSISVLDIKEPKMNESLVNHLKSADFFNVDSFPVATFQFASVEESTNKSDKSEDNSPTHIIKGNLTIKGITRMISFPVSIKFEDKSIVASTPQFTLNRTEWSINYGSKSIFANLKDNFIHDEMAIRITVYSN